MKPLIPAITVVLLLAAGCSGHKHAEAPKPETNTKVEVRYDICPAPESSESPTAFPEESPEHMWPASSTPETLEETLRLIDVNQVDAEARLTQVEEQFELKKPTMSQSEIEEFELQLRIAKEAFRYLKEQNEEFRRLIEDE